MADLGGVTFKPSEEQAAMGKRRAGREGLQQAIQLLSLRYPKVMGAASPVGDPSLLAGNGPRIGGGFNPDAAILQAMIRALSSGGSSVVAESVGSPRGTTPQSRQGGSRSMQTPNRLPAPSFTPGVDIYGTPPPKGDVTKEWTPPQADPLRTVPGDPAAAAQRSSAGYRNTLLDKYDYLNTRSGFR